MYVCMYIYHTCRNISRPIIILLFTSIGRRRSRSLMACPHWRRSRWRLFVDASVDKALESPWSILRVLQLEKNTFVVYLIKRPRTFCNRSWFHIAIHLVVVVVVGTTLFKSLRLGRFKSDRDKVWQDCSSSKYAVIDGVGFLTWRHTFKMADKTSTCRLLLHM